MTAMLLYRIASVLLLLFAIGNAFVFRRTEPGWGVDSVVKGMRNTRFEIQGLSRRVQIIAEPFIDLRVLEPLAGFAVHLGGARLED